MVIGLALAGLFPFASSVHAACSNSSPLPAGYAVPCPVFSVSPASVPQTGTLTLTATPQAGTDYIYTTAYYAKGSTWLPVILSGNNTAPSYSSGPATGSLSASILSTLTPGTNYVVLWDWLWDATAGCYKGPGLNQCNTGTWRLQSFNLAAGTAGMFSIGDRIQVISFQSSASVNVRSTPSVSAVSLGTQPTDAQGVVIGGPTTADGYTWWQINYDTGVDGWSAEYYLQKAGSPYAYSQSAYAGYVYSQSAYTSGCTNCNNYYVSTSGSDSNNGTSASTPWKTMSHAISAFFLGSGGTVIHVAAGTYGEKLSCGGWNSVFCINRGGSSQSVRLRVQCDTQWSVPSGSGCLLRNSSTQSGIVVFGNNVDVVGFDYSNTNESYGIAVVCGLANIQAGNCPTGNSVHILNNYVHDLSQEIPCPTNPSGADGIQYGNQHGGRMIDGQVIGNQVSNIGPQSQSELGGNGSCTVHHGLYMATSEVKVQNNIVENITAYGIHYYSGPCRGVITNNTVVRTGRSNIILAGGDCANGVAAGNVTIANNIVSQSAHYGVQLGALGGGVDPCSSSHPILVSNNIFYGHASGQVGQAASCTTITGSKSEAPDTTFVNYLGTSRDDYHLKSGSAAINGGTIQCVSGGLNPCTPSTDITGKTRSTPIDIGAYEQ